MKIDIKEYYKNSIEYFLDEYKIYNFKFEIKTVNELYDYINTEIRYYQLYNNQKNKKLYMIETFETTYENKEIDILKKISIFYDNFSNNDFSKILNFKKISLTSIKKLEKILIYKRVKDQYKRTIQKNKLYRYKNLNYNIYF